MRKIWAWVTRPFWQEVATAPTDEVVRQCLFFGVAMGLLAGGPFILRGRWLLGLGAVVLFTIIVLPVGFVRRSNARQRLEDEEDRLSP